MITQPRHDKHAFTIPPRSPIKYQRLFCGWSQQDGAFYQRKGATS
ncbi:hypothetical protein [Dictyobacter alpinus]|nr:hypothetical protein [Dictyobacter alpinus]